MPITRTRVRRKGGALSGAGDGGACGSGIGGGRKSRGIYSGGGEGEGAIPTMQRVDRDRRRRVTAT